MLIYGHYQAASRLDRLESDYYMQHNSVETVRVA